MAVFSCPPESGEGEVACPVVGVALHWSSVEVSVGHLWM
jgi:hypothetical protein